MTIRRLDTIDASTSRDTSSSASESAVRKVELALHGRIDRVVLEKGTTDAGWVCS